jgi:hypothetical protein
LNSFGAQKTWPLVLTANLEYLNPNKAQQNSELESLGAHNCNRSFIEVDFSALPRLKSSFHVTYLKASRAARLSSDERPAISELEAPCITEATPVPLFIFLFARRSIMRITRASMIEPSAHVALTDMAITNRGAHLFGYRKEPMIYVAMKSASPTYW